MAKWLLLGGLAYLTAACGGSVDADQGAGGSGAHPSGGAGGSGNVGGVGGSGNVGGVGGSGNVGGVGGTGGTSSGSCADADAPWEFFELPSKQLAFVPFRELWGRSANDIWMIGDSELEHHHFDGTSWQPSPGPGVEGFFPSAVTGDAKATFISNSLSWIFRCDASSCMPISQPSKSGMLTDLWSPAQDRLIAVRSNGGVGFWNGSEWAEYYVNPPNSFAGSMFSALHGSGGQVFAVTNDTGYAAYHFAAELDPPGAFNPTEIPTLDVTGLVDVWSVAPDRAFAVGQASSSPAVLVELTPASAKLIPIVLPAPFELVFTPRAVWASSENDVWVVVHASDGQGFDDSLVVHWSGSEWRVIESLSIEQQDFAQNIDVWGFGANHVLVASTEGVRRCVR